MNFGELSIKRVKFPGAAGSFQRDAATASLLRELGDNYAHYHAFLVAEAERVGGHPDPADYSRDEAGFGRYAEDCAYALELVIAEALLRKARANRVFGTSLREPDASGRPLVDANRRLVSVIGPAPVALTRTDWTPPTMPDWEKMAQGPS